MQGLFREISEASTRLQGLWSFRGGWSKKVAKRIFDEHLSSFQDLLITILKYGVELLAMLDRVANSSLFGCGRGE